MTHMSNDKSFVPELSYLIPMLVKSTLFNINIYSFHDNELSMTSSKYR